MSGHTSALLCLVSWFIVSTLTLNGGSTRVSSKVQAGAWKKENTEEALIIDAESMGLGAPAELTLNDLLNEEESEGGGSDDEEQNGYAE